MELQEVEIIIEKDGRVRIEVRGVKGEACLELTKELEEALGGQIELREMTPEALEPNPIQSETHQQTKSG
ncbi:MAG: DUF2997 domain-containing protein [Anaerolineales bacterium]|nr:DUF2997 domain-containing protein [Anaerolineales bacterium]